MRKRVNKEGVCPMCGCPELEKGEGYKNENNYIVPWECLKCSTKGLYKYDKYRYQYEECIIEK